MLTSLFKVYMTRTQRDGLIKKFDKNGDDLLQFDEFLYLAHQVSSSTSRTRSRARSFFCSRALPLPSAPGLAAPRRVALASVFVRALPIQWVWGWLMGRSRQRIMPWRTRGHTSQRIAAACSTSRQCAEG